MKVMKAWMFSAISLLLNSGVTGSNSETCPESTIDIGICLHTYLERDFTGLETYMELKGGPPLIDGPEIETHCNNLIELVDCYSELDGSCYNLLTRMRYSYLIHGLFKLVDWLCEDNTVFKDLLENLHCIERVRFRPLCSLKNVTDNVWQQMLRLQVGEDSCQPIKDHVACLRATHLVEKECGQLSEQMFLRGTEIWLEHWCLNSGKLTSSLNLFLLVLVFIVTNFCRILY